MAPGADTPRKSAIPSLFARLFGEQSPEVVAALRTPGQWRRSLRKVVKELEGYLEANVESDPVHEHFCRLALSEAREVLDEADFWPEFATRLVFLALLLMGDLPDHGRRRGGARRSEHFTLRRHRTLAYFQTAEQRHRLLYTIRSSLKKDPRDASFEFGTRFGKKSSREFMRRYRNRYPNDYLKIV